MEQIDYVKVVKGLKELESLEKKWNKIYSIANNPQSKCDCKVCKFLQEEEKEK